MTLRPSIGSPHFCGRCGAPACYGFGPPMGQPDRGRIWACSDHQDAARDWHRATYHTGPDRARRQDKQPQARGGGGVSARPQDPRQEGLI